MWKRKEDQGFDAVVGNPPYEELTEHASGRVLPEKDFIKAQPLYRDARGGRLNVFRPFILRAVTLLISGGHHSFIVPMALLGDKFTESLRRRLLTDGVLRSVVAFPQKDDPRDRVFFEAKLSTCVYTLENRHDVDEPISIRFYPGRSFEDAPVSYALHVSDIADIDPESFSIPNMTAQDMPRLEAIGACRRVVTWGDVAKCYLGELMTNAKNWHLTSNEPIGPRLLRGANINRYMLLSEPKQGQPLYLLEDKFLHEYAGDSRVNHHRRMRIGFQESSPIDNWRRLIACAIPAGHYCVHKVRYFTDESKYGLFALLALFNSELSDWRFSMTSTNNSVNEYEINALPIPRFECFDTAGELGVHLDEESIDILSGSNSVDLVTVWETAVVDEITNTPGEAHAWPNSIHDALSASGRELTRLRESRQDLIEDFAAWLFTTLRVDREKFTGRTHLQGGQANVDQQSWEWLRQMLGRNRSACGVDPLSKETELRARYDHFIIQVRQCNAKFSALDQATDRIVWQLVGLNPDGSVQ